MSFSVQNFHYPESSYVTHIPLKSYLIKRTEEYAKHDGCFLLILNIARFNAEQFGVLDCMCVAVGRTEILMVLSNFCYNLSLKAFCCYSKMQVCMVVDIRRRN